MPEKSKILTSKLNELIYGLVLYNRWAKRLVVNLLKQKIIVENPLYQKIYRQTIKNKISSFSKVPFRVMLENTNICNADCIFCPHSRMKRKTGVMEMGLFKKIINQCVDLKIDYVTIYGFGEPFLDNKFIDKIIYAKSKGLKRLTTNTNAAYLNRDKAEALIEAGLDEIYISFDAATKETYQKIRPNLNFETVEKNIIYLAKLKKQKKSLRPLIYLSFVETSTNKKEIKTYQDKWQGLVDGISFSQVHNWTGTVAFGSAEKLPKDPCRLLWTDMVISYDGKVPLCCNDYENKIILGDLKKENIPQIWGGKILAKIREKHLRRQFSEVAICSDCQYNYHHKSSWWVGK